MLICHASSIFYLSTFFSAAVSSKSLGIDLSISSESLLSHSLILPFAPFIRIEHDEVAKKKKSITGPSGRGQSSTGFLTDVSERPGLWNKKQGERPWLAPSGRLDGDQIYRLRSDRCVGEGILEEGLKGYQISPIRVREGRAALSGSGPTRVRDGGKWQCWEKHLTCTDDWLMPSGESTLGNDYRWSGLWYRCMGQ